MIRIAIVSDTYPSSSDPVPAAFVHARAKAYKDAGNPVCVLTCCQGPDERADEFEEVKIIRSTGAQKARHMLQEWDPDVVCVHAPVCGSFAVEVASSFSSVPIVAWIHGYEALLTSLHGYNRNVIKRFLTLPRDGYRLVRLRRFLAGCRGVVFVSSWMKRTAERYLGGFTHPGSVVIPNLVDTDLFRPNQEAARDDIRGLRGLSVRNLTNWKYGIDVAVRAYSQLNVTSLTIIGDGPLRHSLERMACALKASVEIRPDKYAHRQMAEVYRAFDYFVAPSRTEAQGLAMCEAMSCGLPVIGTTAGGISEFVRNGIDGHLVRPGDWTGMRRAVMKLIQDREFFHEMGRNARQRIIETCGKERVLERELRFMEECIHQ